MEEEVEEKFLIQLCWKDTDGKWFLNATPNTVPDILDFLTTSITQAIAEERERMMGLLPEEAETAEAVELNRSEPDGAYTPPFAHGLVVGWNSYRQKLKKLLLKNITLK